MTGASGRVARLGDRLPVGLVDAAWLWLVLRVGLGLIAALLVVRGVAPGPCNSDLVINGWTTFPPLADHGLAFPLVGVWQHWDACWYSKIAAYGYEPGTSATNFFPALPFLMGGVAVLTGGSVALAGLVVNAFAFVIALAGLRQLVETDVDRPTAERAVLYLAAFPAAFFFLAPFTESLFLAGAVWSIAGARRGRWDIAAVAGIVAGLTRPQGILLVLPLGWEAARALWTRWRSATPVSSATSASSAAPDGPRGGRRLALADLAPIVAVLMPALAYGGYVAYTVVVLRQPYFDAHGTWASTGLQVPWDVAADALSYVGTNQAAVTLLDLSGLVLFTLLAVAGIRRLPLAYTLYTLPQLALMITQHTVWPLMSTTRYLLVLFPCFVVLAMVGRHPRLHTAWLAISLLLLGLLTTLFVQGAFVG